MTTPAVMDRQEPQTRPSDLSDWMTAEELAQWLGMTTRRLSVNQIPHAKIGESRFYNKVDVAAWLDRRVTGRW